MSALLFSDQLSIDFHSGELVQKFLLVDLNGTMLSIVLISSKSGNDKNEEHDERNPGFTRFDS
jgi:hypothetical protein